MKSKTQREVRAFVVLSVAAIAVAFGAFLPRAHAGNPYQAPGAANMSGSGHVFDPIVPVDGTQNITGALAVSTTATAVDIVTDRIQTKTAAGNLIFKDSAANTLFTVQDDGTTGTLIGSGALSAFQAGTAAGGTTIDGNGRVKTFFVQAAADANNLSIRDGAQNVIATFADDGTTGSLWSDTIRPLTANGNLVFKDQAGNTLATLTDAGTTGNFATTGTISGPAGTLVDATGNVSAAAGTVFYALGGGTTIYASNATNQIRGTSISFTDPANNVEATFFDDGTTGSLLVTGTKTKGQVTLNADGTTNSTITVNSGAICLVEDETAAVTEPAHSVTTTTLTIVNNAVNKGHVVDYICL